MGWNRASVCWSLLIFSSHSLFLCPHPPSLNFVAYFFGALKNCLWRGLDESCWGEGEGRLGSAGQRKRVKARPFIFLPRPPSCLTPPPHPFLSLAPSHVVRLLIGRDSCMWNKKQLSFMWQTLKMWWNSVNTNSLFDAAAELAVNFQTQKGHLNSSDAL